MTKLLKFVNNQNKLIKKILYLIFAFYFYFYENKKLDKKNNNLNQPSDDVYPLF